MSAPAAAATPTARSAAFEATKPTEAPAAAAPASSSDTAATTSAEQPAALPVVTAGMIDDNKTWDDYLAYRSRHIGIVPAQHDRDVGERYVIWLRDQFERAIPDAEVKVLANNEPVFTARSDAQGRVLFHPKAVNAGTATTFKVIARKVNQHTEVVFQSASKTDLSTSSSATPSASSHDWVIEMNHVPLATEAQLDLVFLVDVTGSMGDELSKLQATMGEIANQISQLPQKPSIRYGLVAYGDRGDEFVVKGYDFTSELATFQSNLNGMPTVGGGDTPESLNAGLHHALHQMSWRDQDTVRLLILMADAPPHLDYTDEPFSYDQDMLVAAAKGVKIIAIGASGLDGQGEYIYRQLAQFTGGKFVFLTYAEPSNSASGPGTQTDHDVTNYGVDTLDRLIVRVVRDELDALPKTQ
ncbi:MAG: VWA domain-containing protein [Anaerolineae bacterium]|nr:VWA domain-containing protein [Anaerolineae bacterium]